MSPKHPLPGTIASIAVGKSSRSVFYQLPNRKIIRSIHHGGGWDKGELQAPRPIALSPLASVTFSDGKQIRVYYLDEDHVLQEFCYTEGKDQWYVGEIGKLKLKPAPHAGLAAAATKGSPHVYFQERENYVISEVVWKDGAWHKGRLSLAGAINGTNISVVEFRFQGHHQARLYYQAGDLSLREYCHKDDQWYPGEFNPGIAFGRTAIGAIAFGEAQLQVYWHDLQGRVVFSRYTGKWSPHARVEGIVPSHGLTVLQWDNGKNIRVYCQEREGHVSEFSSDNGGDKWGPGKRDVSA